MDRKTFNTAILSDTPCCTAPETHLSVREWDDLRHTLPPSSVCKQRLPLASKQALKSPEDTVIQGLCCFSKVLNSKKHSYYRAVTFYCVCVCTSVCVCVCPFTHYMNATVL